MRVGQIAFSLKKVLVISQILRDDNLSGTKAAAKPRPATVVYIHPKKYFFTVEYQTNGGAVRECFCWK